MSLSDLIERDKITMDLLGPYTFWEPSSSGRAADTYERRRYVAVFKIADEDQILLVPKFTIGDKADTPTATDVLSCVISDALGVENARDFRDWAAEYGYDGDSMRALDTYNACAKERDELHEFLGALFDDYMSSAYDD